MVVDLLAEYLISENFILKAKVGNLIRGMGSPTTYGVEVPRQAMLRELGLPH